MAFTYITVTHTFETAGDTAATGTVDFTPIAPMHNGITVVKKTVTVPLNATGAISQLLAANTDPDTIPVGTVYEVTERITGQTALTYYVQIPHDGANPVDLRALAGWTGITGGGGTVSSINSETPDSSGNIVLSASDVGAQPADGDLDGLAALGNGAPYRSAGAWAVVSGTPDGTKFYRDDGSWQVPAGGSSYTDEQVRDVIGAALVAGPNVTITPNDGADTITIQAATSGSSGIPASTVDAKGDLIAGTANDTVARKSVGTDGQALLADSAQSTGLAWGAPVPADSSVTNAKVATGAAISADKTADGTTNKVFTATEKTKLAGLPSTVQYQTVQDEGSARTQRATLNFVGAGVTVTDDSGNSRTLVTIPGGSAAAGAYINVKSDYGAVGDSSTNDTTAFQNAATAAAGKTLYVPASTGFYQITGPISVAANTRIVVDENATIRQATKYKAVWDVFNATDVTIIGGKYRYEGNRGFVSSGAVIGRGGGDNEFSAAVWTNSARTTVKNIQVYGFECGVMLSGWVGANGSTGAVTTAATADCYIDDMRIDTCTFGVLATGQKGAVINNLRGNYVTDTSGESPSPGHFIYFSDSNSARSRDITITNLYAHDAVSSDQVIQLKNVDGAIVRNVVARSCDGLISIANCSNLLMSGMSSVTENDPGTASLLMQDTTSSNCVVRDVYIQSTHGAREARFDGTDCRFENIRIDVSRSVPGSFDTTIEGTRNIVSNLIVRNAGATPYDSIQVVGTDCVLNYPEVAGSNTAIAVNSSAVRALVNYDPGMLSVVAPTSLPPVIVSGTPTGLRCRRLPFSGTVTLGGAGQIDTITALQTHLYATINGTQAFTMTAPAQPLAENELTYTFINTSGGAMGTITWNAVFHLASTFTGPANGSRRSITFRFDGTTWREISRSG